MVKLSGSNILCLYKELVGLFLNKQIEFIKARDALDVLNNNINKLFSDEAIARAGKAVYIIAALVQASLDPVRQHVICQPLIKYNSILSVA